MHNTKKEKNTLELLILVLRELKRLPEKHATKSEKNELLRIEDSFCDTHPTNAAQS